VLGLDSLERNISLFAAAIALIFALITAIDWIRNTPVTTTKAYVKGKACPTSYPRHFNTFCEHVNRHARSYWEVRFFFVFVVAVLLLYFTVRRKRAGVACFAVFLGLGLGLGAGVVFLILGVWLILRAYRLQKYGVPGMLASNRLARDGATARRENRTPSKPTATIARSSSDATSRAVTPPAASKRYTPKKPPRKRR
jgi:hypothetical protein